MSVYRTHLLLDTEQHQALAQLARQEGRSISDLAREFIQEGIDQRQQLLAAQRDRRMQALEKARQVRHAILQERGGIPLDLHIPETVADLREERNDQIFSRGN